MEQYNILIVEDDKEIRDGIEIFLKSQNYNVFKAADGVEGLEVMEREKISLAIVDIMMPRMDGLEACTKIREFSGVPIIMLTAKSEDMDKLMGFEHGADDYLTKPVDYEELIWRIQALLRRAHIASEQQILVGNTRLDSASYTVTCRGQTLELPKKEFDLLYKLLSYPGQIFTRSQMLDDVWGYVSESGEDTVKTHISRLRNRLKDVDDFQIITIKGLGYKAELVKEKEQ
mgnify:CR=1 FL=1